MPIMPEFLHPLISMQDIDIIALGVHTDKSKKLLVQMILQPMKETALVIKIMFKQFLIGKMIEHINS